VKLKTTNDQKLLNNHYPDSKNKLSKIVNDLYKNKQKMIVLGGGTKTEYGNPYSSVQNVFTSELNKVIDYNPSDLTITVEAGMKVETLMNLLSENNQYLGYILPNKTLSSIGGSTAYGYSGNYRFNDIHIRDSIIGIEAINYKGDFIKSGGQVVKNVSGYDLHKLYIGTQGIFGPIYSISFKVYPKPNYETQIIIGFENYEDIINITKKYLPLNWNIPRLAIYSSNKPKRKLYELFCNISGTKNVVDYIKNSIAEDIKLNNGNFEELNNDSNISSNLDDFGYNFTDDQLSIRILSSKNSDFQHIINYFENCKFNFQFLINPAIGSLSLLIENSDNILSYIDEIFEISQLNNYRIILDYSDISLRNRLRNKFKNNDNNSILNLTTSLKKKYDPQNLFSPGKII
tara:strand:+ start:8708 stop:9913 length:1206 start_codon:yes stop_codon:yes gene_type:complete